MNFPTVMRSHSPFWPRSGYLHCYESHTARQRVDSTGCPQVGACVKTLSRIELCSTEDHRLHVTIEVIGGDDVIPYDSFLASVHKILIKCCALSDEFAAVDLRWPKETTHYLLCIARCLVLPKTSNRLALFLSLSANLHSQLFMKLTHVIVTSPRILHN